MYYRSFDTIPPIMCDVCHIARSVVILFWRLHCIHLFRSSTKKERSFRGDALYKMHNFHGKVFQILKKVVITTKPLISVSTPSLDYSIQHGLHHAPTDLSYPDPAMSSVYFPKKRGRKPLAEKGKKRRKRNRPGSHVKRAKTAYFFFLEVFRKNYVKEGDQIPRVSYWENMGILL